MNKVNDRVLVNHTIVEEPVHLMGELKNASTLAAKDFPDCDVLVMDCEGAELPILQNIKIKPRLIIVETHPMFNSPKSKIIPLLNKLDYEIFISVEEYITNQRQPRSGLQPFDSVNNFCILRYGGDDEAAIATSLKPSSS